MSVSYAQVRFGKSLTCDKSRKLTVMTTLLKAFGLRSLLTCVVDQFAEGLQEVVWVCRTDRRTTTAALEHVKKRRA